MAEISIAPVVNLICQPSLFIRVWDRQQGKNSYWQEGMPDRTGLQLSKELVALGIPVKLVIDSAVAYTMDEVDMVFVGADGVVESGGIINMIGTYQISLVAHSMNKPVYVAAESYKFARLYPLDQKDLPPAVRPIDFGLPIPAGVEVEKSARDYTPPQYLTLLFTDLGVLTPSAVSDFLPPIAVVIWAAADPTNCWGTSLGLAHRRITGLTGLLCFWAPSDSLSPSLTVGTVASAIVLGFWAWTVAHFVGVGLTSIRGATQVKYSWVDPSGTLKLVGIG
ncbi:hypothetical protein ACLOJK_009020 [Asimina triloba]